MLQMLLVVKGVSVTQVIANGITVWLQSLINITNGWTNDSLASVAYTLGLQVSGTSFRAYDGFYGSGAWISTSALGAFSGNSIPAGFDWPIYTSGSSMRLGSSGWLTYDPSTATWSGGTTTSSYANLITTGGGVYFFWNYFGGYWGPVTYLR